MRLAEKGYSVLVIEKGKKFKIASWKISEVRKKNDPKFKKNPESEEKFSKFSFAKKSKVYLSQNSPLGSALPEPTTPSAHEQEPH